LLPQFLKVGSAIYVSTYRSIAKLSTVGKLFELLVYRHMYENLKAQLADCQHGFVKDRSTGSNLLEYSSFVFEVSRGWVSGGFNLHEFF
jgi:hypothetical protein